MWKKKHQNQREEPFERNRPLRFVFLFVSFYCTYALLGANYFSFNKKLYEASVYNYELRIEKALDIIKAEQLESPENSAVLYALHFNAYIKAFVTEDQEDYSTYRKIQSKALFHFENLPDSSRYKKFIQSEVYFHSATLKAKFDEMYGAARDLNRSKSLIEENHDLFPSFLPNNKTRGVLKMYLSTVPDNYAWITKILGISGDLNGGLRLLNTLGVNHRDSSFLGIVAKESAYLHAFGLMHVAKRNGKAWAATLKCTSDYQTNSLSCFFRGSMALKLNKNESAIKIFESRPQGRDYLPFYFLSYQLGVAKLHKSDKSCLADFLRFYENFKGRNYIKSCLQKISWHYTVVGDYQQAIAYQNRIKSEGVSLNDQDKVAHRFSEKGAAHIGLLKARLYYDGGYYTRSAEMLGAIDGKKLANKDLKAEYCYRNGRVLEKQGKMNAAIKYYEAASLYGVDSEEYYAAYASIYVADYYLSIGDKVGAKRFYKRALDFPNNKEFQSSVEQRAKAGLKKI